MLALNHDGIAYNGKNQANLFAVLKTLETTVPYFMTYKKALELDMLAWWIIAIVALVILIIAAVFLKYNYTKMKLKLYMQSC